MLSAMKHMVHPSSTTPTQQQGAKGAPPRPPTAIKHTSWRSSSGAQATVHKSKPSNPLITGFDGSYRHQRQNSHDSPYDATVLRAGNAPTSGSAPLAAFASSSQGSTPTGTASVPSLATQGTTGGYYPNQPTSNSALAPGTQPLGSSVSQIGGSGMAHVPGSTAFARANAADRFKPHKPSNDLWGVNPEPWMDFATPESEMDAVRAAEQHHLNRSVYQQHGSGANSAASSQFDMETILRGGRRINSHPDEDLEDQRPHGGMMGTESSASPLPERDWSTVGSGNKKPKQEKHEHHGLKIRPRRFTLNGKKGLMMDSPPPAPTVAAATPASAPAATSSAPRTQAFTTMGTSPPTMPKPTLLPSHPLSSKSPGVTSNKSFTTSPHQGDGVIRAPGSLTSPMAIGGSNATSSTGGTSGTSGDSTTSTSNSGQGQGHGRRSSMWQKLAKLGRTNSTSHQA